MIFSATKPSIQKQNVKSSITAKELKAKSRSSVASSKGVSEPSEPTKSVPKPSESSAPVAPPKRNSRVLSPTKSSVTGNASSGNSSETKAETVSPPPPVRKTYKKIKKPGTNGIE